MVHEHNHGDADERDKLKSLLEYWLKHTTEHRQEFEEWVERAGRMGEKDAGRAIAAAVKDMAKASKELEKALKSLSGKEA